ncbi:MAG: beta-ketoacyl synthase N-terminal-like domain-containing protein, partial [Minicystis sp.]
MLGPEERIAIIGLAGRFAGAPTIDALAALLESGRTGISYFSDAELLAAGVPASLVADPAYVKARFALEGAENFDAAFFSLTPREAALLNPQQRLFLEQCWAALEDAGQAGEKRPTRAALFASASRSAYQAHLLRCLGEEALSPFALDGTLNDFMASRVAHKLDFRGPVLMVQTACSSSLHAVHLACQSLLTGECDLALAGAASITVPTRAGALALTGGITSPDGHCRAFDAGAAGTVGGDAVVVIVLKRLEDALRDRDHVRALILGSAVNNDGAARAGFTAPAVEGQAAVIRQAMSMASVTPGEIGYVEAHGSGTPLGDPIEIAALSQAFTSAVPRQSCPVGAVKPSIGHTDVAAGLAGLVKVVLGLERKLLFPTAHFQRPNPHIDFPQTPFFVQTELAPWPARHGTRKAGVSSFGMGGSNAHVVLEEAPAVPAPLAKSPSPPWKLLVLSARSRPALVRMTTQLAEHLHAHSSLDLADVAHSLQVGRSSFAHRQTLLVQTANDAVIALKKRDLRVLLESHVEGAPPSLTFLFPGLGDSLLGLSSTLAAQAPAFGAELDRCAEILSPLLSIDVRTLLAPPDPTPLPAPSLLRPPTPLLQPTHLTQPLLLALELSLAAFLRSLGLRPTALLGHSLGEYAAAVTAGVFSREDALSLVAERARLISTLPPGAMLALPLSSEEIALIAAPGVSLAAINGARMSVVGGSREAIDDLAQQLGKKGIASMRLPVEHAFHTEAMRPIAASFAARVAAMERHPPQIPTLSNLSGDWLTAAQAQDPLYWAEHLCRPVRFHQALTRLLGDPARLLVELGPGSTLTSLARLAAQGDSPTPHLALPPLSLLVAEPGSAAPPWLEALAALWRAGLSLDWEALDPRRRARRVPLPTYPFEPTRHWIDGPNEPLPITPAPNHPAPMEASVTSRALPRERAIAPRNPRESALLAAFQQAFGLPRIGLFESFFSLGGHSLLAIQLLHRIKKDTGMQFTVRQLLEHPTVAALAALPLDESALPHGPSLRAQLAQAVDEETRRRLLEAYLAEQLALALGCSLEQVRASDDLRPLGLAHNLADLVIAVKRDLGHPLYAHELLARPTLTGLLDLLLHLDQPASPITSP